MKSNELLDLTENLEISVAYDGHQDDDDEISCLSFGDNRSYIFDLAGQKKNRRQLVQQEAFEEAQELYEIALEEGADKSQELLMAIFHQVEKELTESYKEKDKLLDERIEAALQAELDRRDASIQHPTSSEAKVAQLDKKLKTEETNILKKKIAKVKSIIKGIVDDKDALNDKKKSTQLRRLQKKHDQYEAALKEQNDNKSQPSMVLESALQELNDVTRVESDSTDETDNAENTMRQVDTIAIPEKTPKVTSGVKSSQKDSTHRHVQKSKSKGAESPTQSPKLHSTKATSSREVSPVGSKDTSKRRIKQPEAGISSHKSGDTATTAVDTVTAGGKKYYSIEDFKSGKIKDGQVEDMSKWEEYLSPSEFENYFGMSKADFDKIPTWKQKNVKRKLRTWY
jgi:hypothetical protein